MLGAPLLWGVLALAAAAPAAAMTFSPCTSASATDFSCATLSVPLERSGAEGGSLNLAVERLQSGPAPSKAAVVALAGGPGQAALPLAAAMAKTIAPALDHERPGRVRPARHGQLRRAQLPGFGRRRNAGLDRPGLRTLRIADRAAARGLYDPGIGRRHRGAAPGGRLRKAGVVRRVLRDQGGAGVRRTLSAERGSAGARFGRAARTRRPFLGGHVQSDEAGVRRVVLERRLRRHHFEPARGHRPPHGPPAHTCSQRLGVRRHGTPPPRDGLECGPVEPDRRGRPEPRPEGVAAGLGAIGPARRPGSAAAPGPAVGGPDPEPAGHPLRRLGRDRRSAVRGHHLRRVGPPLAARGGAEDAGSPKGWPLCGRCRRATSIRSTRAPLGSTACCRGACSGPTPLPRHRPWGRCRACRP